MGLSVGEPRWQHDVELDTKTRIVRCGKIFVSMESGVDPSKARSGDRPSLMDDSY